MASPWRSLRRRILTPGVSNTKLSVRGFYEKNDVARETLETVGRSFLEGYGLAAEARTPEEPEEALETLPRQYRGFAYEGAAMGFAVRDALPFGRGGRTIAFLNGRGRHHSYMIYVGAGWALARVPRFRWSKLELGDPLLRWLMLDGYGFHQAYFKTKDYVTGQRQESADFPWEDYGASWYKNRVIDQGIGRAMWFVCGTDAMRVADAFDGFAKERHADLWAGAGLAATYAGGVEESELRAFLGRAGVNAPYVAQGAAFGATARVEAGLAIEHTGIASQVFCEMTPEEAARLCSQTRPPAVIETEESPGIPSYEVWRQRIAAAFGAEIVV